MKLKVEYVAVSEIDVPFLRNVKSDGTGLNKNLLFSLQVSLSRTTRWMETRVSPLFPREP
jgi:hypothetical protein